MPKILSVCNPCKNFVSGLNLDDMFWLINALYRQLDVNLLTQTYSERYFPGRYFNSNHIDSSYFWVYAKVLI